MKYTYSYTKYEGYPEATEISESRERRKTPLILLNFWMVVLWLVLLFGVGFNTIWEYLLAILILGAPVASTVYVFTYYDKVTEKKINKAIKKRDIMEVEIAASKYKCKSLKLLDDIGTGKCWICYNKDVRVMRYRIKNDIGVRDIPICNDCVEKFEVTK